jgi:hypothetical protein
MYVVRLKSILLLAVFAGACLAGSDPVTLRGKLTQAEGKPPALATAEGKLVPLAGDKSTAGVLNDARLAGTEMELRGHFSSDLFQVDPIHTHAMHVHKQGQRLVITYWCATCAIRTYAPGLCWCCQQETALDLREPDKDEQE